MFRLFALAQCLLAISLGSAAANGLPGSEWARGAEQNPFVQFRANGRVFGNAYCNIFHGTYEVNGNTLNVGPLLMTRKHCGSAKGKAERAFITALRSARTFEVQHPELKLVGETGQLLLKLKRRDWD